MSLARKEVENIAALARLRIEENELDSVTQNLSRIVEFVDRLEAARTDDLEPMAHPLAGMTQRLRDDVVDHENQRDRYQENAAAVADGLYLVPRVID